MCFVCFMIVYDFKECSGFASFFDSTLFVSRETPLVLLYNLKLFFYCNYYNFFSFCTTNIKCFCANRVVFMIISIFGSIFYINTCICPALQSFFVNSLVLSIDFFIITQFLFVFFYFLATKLPCYFI